MRAFQASGSSPTGRYRVRTIQITLACEAPPGDLIDTAEKAAIVVRPLFAALDAVGAG